MVGLVPGQLERWCFVTNAAGSEREERRAQGWDERLPVTPRPRISPWVPIALALGDVIAIAAASTAAVALRTQLPLWRAVPEFWSASGLLMIGVWLAVLWLLGLYYRRIDLSVVSTWPMLAVAASLSSMLVLLVSVVLEPVDALPRPLTYAAVTMAWALSLITLPAARVAVRYIQKSVRRGGVSEKRTLIIGAGQVGTLLAEKMLRSPELGLLPVAFWDSEAPESARRDALGLPVYRRSTDLDQTIIAERINHVIVAFSAVSFHDIVGDIERCCSHAVEITVVPRLFEITAVNPRMDEIEGIPIARIHRRGLSPVGKVAKRAFDIIVTAPILLLISPVLAAVAIAIRAESGSPVLFRQTRIGRNGEPFTMYKFRSMVPTAESEKAALLASNELDGPLFKIRNDPRVTGVGQWIRRYSLDELPQLFNVLKGDMSLVGPRPPLPEEVECYSDWHFRRLSVTPGITGLWQILGRTTLSFDEMVSLDLNYAWNWSVWLDFSILMRTLGAVVHGKGAS